jgi:hypothetical protein
VTALAIASQLHANSTYLQALVTLVLLGVGSGVSLVSLTSASLEGVEPADAGAASGLVNVVQQMGAALGLAVLVTVFGATTHHQTLVNRLGRVASAHASSVLVHGLDDVFAAGAVFAVLALVLIGVLVKPAMADATTLEPELLVEAA